MAILIQAQPPGIRITGTSMAVIEARMLDDRAARNGSTSINLELWCPDNRDDTTWFEFVVASQATSLRFLEEEPDIYDDSDGEPV